MERRLAAILAADVVGYSRLMGEAEESTLDALRSHRAVVDELIARHRGRVFASAGDSVVAEFSSAVEAIQAAVEIQQATARSNETVAEPRRLRFRIGINIGDVIVEGDNLFGDGVNVAARVQELAEPGGICVTRNLYNQVRNKVEFGFESLGEHRVKNIAEPVSIYCVATGTQRKGRRIGLLARRHGRHAILATFVLALPVLIAALTWDRRSHDPGCDLALPGKPSIAVLPFDHRDHDPQWARLAEGMTEDVIRSLSRSSGLFVISANSTRAYKGGNVDLRQVGCDLGVKYVLEASMQDMESTVRLTSQLIEAANGRLVWSEVFERAPQDILLVQEELASIIAVRLLGREGELAEAPPPTGNLEAYDYFLRAEVLGRGWSETRREALALYQKAIALDPDFADAYAGYARIVSDVWLYQIDDIMPIPAARKQAYEMAGRALALDSDNPRPYSILSALQSADGRHDLAIDTARKAIALQPNNAEAHAYLAAALTYAGRHEEALAAMETALRTDPRPTPQFRADFGWVLFFNRQFERALRELELAREGGVAYLETLAAVYVRLGRLADASNAAGAMIESGPLSLEYFRVLYSHFKRAEDLDQWLDALRVAGLPEWPFDYRGKAELRLDGKEMAVLTFGRTWAGTGDNDRPFIQEIGLKGAFAYRDATTLITGSVSVESHRLCQRSEAFLMGRKHCGYVYRNPDGSPESKDQYVYVNAYAIYRFSVMP